MSNRWLAVFLLTTSLFAQDWTQWRGPNRDGAAPAFREPKAWPERLQLLWKQEVGLGYANPVVVDDRVYVHTRQGGNEVVQALSLASGKEMWKHSYPAPYKMVSAAAPHGEGPKSTPVAAEGRLFTFGISGVLAAWDLKTSQQVWAKDFTKEYPTTWPEFGVAMSPIVDRGTVIAHVGGDKEGMLAAFAVANGQVKWSWKGDSPAYASPVIATFDGVRQLVTQSRENIVSLDPATGAVLWKIHFTTEYEQNIITPIMYKDTVILSGLDKGVVAMRPKKAGGNWTTDQVWTNKDLPQYMSTPVLAGDYLYGMTHKKRGAYFCLDARTGATQWVTAGRDGESAALLSAGDSVLILNPDGELLVIRKNPKAFELVRKYKIADSATWAAPAVTGQRLLIKDVTTLALWRIE